MSTMINRDDEIIRICPTNTAKIEYSSNGGRSWLLRYTGSGNTSVFSKLMENGNEILGTTSKGLFYSTNKGCSWIFRKK